MTSSFISTLTSRRKGSRYTGVECSDGPTFSTVPGETVEFVRDDKGTDGRVRTEEHKYEDPLGQGSLGRTRKGRLGRSGV